MKNLLLLLIFIFSSCSFIANLVFSNTIELKSTGVVELYSDTDTTKVLIIRGNDGILYDPCDYTDSLSVLKIGNKVSFTGIDISEGECGHWVPGPVLRIKTIKIVK